MADDGRFYELKSREQPQLFGPSLSQMVANEPDVLAVDAAVNQLDLSALEAQYRRVGHPAYPPVVMLKLLVYGYALGLRASREMERACRLDLAFRFLTHELEPDFRTICRFRRKHAPELAELFTQTVRLCQQAGLVQLGHVAVDGTKVRANRAFRTLKEAQQALTQALVEAEAADADIPAEAAPADEECVLMKTTAGVKPAYNAQLAVDAAQQVIVAQQVVVAENDYHQLAPMVEQVQANCQAPPAAVSADGSYAAQAALQQLDQLTAVHVPIEQLGATRFQWVEAQQAYRCPAGQWLRWCRERKGNRIYRTNHCRGCLHAAECGVTGRTKEIHVAVEVDPRVLNRVARRMRSAKGRALYAARKQIVEPVFGWLKHNRGFVRFLLRGRVGAGAEWSLMCIAHNLGKWAQAGGLSVTDEQRRRQCAGAPQGVSISRRIRAFGDHLRRALHYLIHLRPRWRPQPIRAAGFVHI